MGGPAYANGGEVSKQEKKQEMNYYELSPCSILGTELAFISIISFNYPGEADIIFPFYTWANRLWQTVEA